MKPLSPEAKTSRFAPYSINAGHAIVEAQRCLGCHDAPCTQACPVHIDVPGFIRRIAQNNLAGSNQLLLERNPLAAVCGLICPTADLCEGACVLPQMGQQAVRIGALQYFVADQFPGQEVVAENGLGKRIAVIGSGPSGLSCAVVLRRYGHQVHLFDRSNGPGGLVAHVIPPYRLLPEALERELRRLEKYGIAFHFGVEVTPEMVCRFEKEYDAVYLGIGLSEVNTASFPGSNFRGVRPALEFLEEARLSASDKLPVPGSGETVVVVGGGNVALDAAIIAKKSGAERVIVLYRRSLEEMPAWRSEYIDAAEWGVEFRWLSTINRIVGEENHVKALEVQPMRRTEALPGKRHGVEPDLSAPPYLLPCQTVLLALGQRLDEAWANEAEVPISGQGTLSVNLLTHQTDHPKLFAGGEAMMGGTTAVTCIADGMAAGNSIHNWLVRQGSDTNE